MTTRTLLILTLVMAGCSRPTIENRGASSTGTMTVTMSSPDNQRQIKDLEKENANLRSMLNSGSRSTPELRKAFESHWQNQFESVKAYYPMAGGEAFVKSENWKNYQKEAKECPQVYEITEVQIGKTSDTGATTVTLIGVDAHEGSDGFIIGRCTLWLAGENGAVRDVSPY